jgi:dihydroorotase
MTLYLTDNTSAEEVRKAKAEGIVGFKLYPAGATTNSDAGVSNIKHCYKALEAMQVVGMPLLVHGEVTHAEIDIFDREAVFIDAVLEPLRKDFPSSKWYLSTSLLNKRRIMYVMLRLVEKIQLLLRSLLNIY